MEQIRRELLHMLRTESFKQGQFTLSSGKKSDFFIDCKRTVLSSRGMMFAGQLVFSIVNNINYIDAVAAVPLGGCPIADAAAMVARMNGIPLHVMYVRIKKKRHGTTRRIERPCNLPENPNIVLIEDVITTGESSIRAIEAVLEAGYELKHMVVLVDRLEGGRERIEEIGVDVHPVFTRDDFIDP